MGKRGPKKGQGGRPITKTDVFSVVQRLRMQKSRALKEQDFEKARQIQNQIDIFSKEGIKQIRLSKIWNSFWYGYASFQGYR